MLFSSTKVRKRKKKMIPIIYKFVLTLKKTKKRWKVVGLKLVILIVHI